MTHRSQFRMNHATITFALLALAVLMPGCTYSETRTRTSTEIFGGKGMLVSNTMTAGQSVRGQAIEVITLGAGAESGGVMMIAGIHGDEPAGVPLVRMLEDHIRTDPDLIGNQQVVIIPRANPDGLASRQRTNSRGVDLNRNFPAANFNATRTNGPKPLSEPESRVIHRMIDLYRPALIVSIHQPIACIDYDGPGKEIAERMADACDLPVRKLGTRPGSLGAYAGEALGIPIITVELPRDAHRLPDDELWAQYGRMLLTALK